MYTSTSSGVVRILRLMTEPEQVAFSTELGLDDAASEEEIINALGALPRYEAVRLLLRASDSTLLLLQDVFEGLESFGFTTRTTGCVFVLSNPANPDERSELVFSQQTVSAVCKWSLRKNWNHQSASLASLESTWQRFAVEWRHLLDKSKPRTSRRLDIGKSSINGRGVYKKRATTDEGARRVLLHFFNRARQMADRLDAISQTRRPQELHRIAQDVRNLEKAVDRCFGDYPRTSAHSGFYELKQPMKHTLYRYVSQKFTHEFDRFLEDIYLLADLIGGEDIVDMLKIGLWSSRPQLYEVWVMMALLRWLRSCGYSIELLKATIDGPNNPLRWDLLYSKESKPCAIVRDQEAGTERFMFYQLYRTTGDMPDISLLEGPNPSSKPIWSVDPKHSERGSYSLAEYMRTAERYRDSFGAENSLVVEYFDRPELGNINPIVFDSRAKLIRSCRPGASGQQLLYAEFKRHYPIKKQILVCIDFSISFSAQRSYALEQLQQQIGVFPDIAVLHGIGFGGNTVIIPNLNEWLQKGKTSELPRPDGLVDGTAAEPLIHAISEFMKQTPIIEVFLVTDGQFDVPLQGVLEKIRVTGGVSVKVLGSCQTH